MKHNFKIIPSAPFKNFSELEKLSMELSGPINRVQIDVCDGIYVPTTSWPFTEYAKGDFEKLGQKPDFDVYLPRWENINYSIDLMVAQPEKYIETFVAYGVDEIIIHARSIEYSQSRMNSLLELARKYELNFVLATDVKDDLEKFIDFAKQNISNLNGFQVMGIEKIGFQGQDFVSESLEVVKRIRKEFKDIDIYFDGAINPDTILDIKKSGVNVFCVGSYLTKADYFEDNLFELKNLLM